MSIVLIPSGMKTEEQGIYSSIDGDYIIFLNKGDIVPTKEGKLQILKHTK